MSGITEIYETINQKADELFEWSHANPKLGLLIPIALLIMLLVGMIMRWKWALHWNFNSKLWWFDDCSPETRRIIQIIIVTIALVGCCVMFFYF